MYHTKKTLKTNINSRCSEISTNESLIKSIMRFKIFSLFYNQVFVHENNIHTILGYGTLPNEYSSHSSMP